MHLELIHMRGPESPFVSVVLLRNIWWKWDECPNVYSFFFFVIKEMNLKTELPLERQNKDILFMIPVKWQYKGGFMNSNELAALFCLHWLRKREIIKKNKQKFGHSHRVHFFFIAAKTFFPPANLVMSPHFPSLNCFFTQWNEFQCWQLLIMTVTAQQGRQLTQICIYSH